MTQEEKELLLIDLCSRLPHGVIAHCETNEGKFDGVLCSVMGDNVLIKTKRRHGVTPNIDCKVDSVKPYLRPMSSMTEEERDEYESFVKSGYTDTGSLNGYYEYECVEINDIDKFVSWLDKNMFDHRKTDEGKTMIEAGLALEALEGMYNDKK